MGKFKHWDEATQSWVIDGASNASNLELSNPGFVDEEGHSVSIDHGFTKVWNRLDKLEKNVAWVYLNGTGSGGTGGGTTGESYTIELPDGDTAYTATSSASIRIQIISGTIPRTFTVIAKNVSTGAVLGTWQRASLSTVTLDFNNLSGSTEIEISAYDGNSNYAIPAYVTIVAGAIRLSVDNKPTAIDRGAPAGINVTYTITNNIAGSPAAFNLTMNGAVVASVENITTSPRTLIYNIRDFIFTEGSTIETGQKFTFSGVATTVLAGDIISSNTETFTVSVAESNSLLIITDGISEFEPSETVGQTYADLKTYPKNAQLAFSYYLSYSPSNYDQFKIVYSVYLMQDGQKVSETPIVTNANDENPIIVYKNANNFSIGTINDFEVSIEPQYLMVEISASAVNDPSDVLAQYTKQVYCRLTVADSADLYANNDLKTLLGYFSKVSGFPGETATSWFYNISNISAFPYEDIFLNQFPNNKLELKLVGTNGSTSGFRLNSDGVNLIPAIVLPGESYAYLKVAQQMFPNYDIGSGYGFFQEKGFNISITYRADRSSNPNEVILSLGRYADELLASGIEISLEKVLVQIGSADSIECKLPQDELLTIDIDVSKQGSTAWYFKIYVNGVLSAVTRVLQTYIDWKFAKDLYIGCRDNAGVQSRFSNVSVYDLKVYTSSQTEYAITQNYISATEQASLLLGSVDPTLDLSLRTKNFFDASGECLIWNYDLNEFYDGGALYAKLEQQMSQSTPYPLLFIEETSASTTNLEAYSNAVFPASDKEVIMGSKFPCKITFKSEIGTTVIETPNGVDSTNGVSIGLQGTSSLSYNAKNYELYLGNMDNAGKKLLFQPISEWLPENEFTLKADVMDSAHVNNVVIGKIINGAVQNLAGNPIKPLSATPPMLDPSVPVEIRDKIKHTSDGFSCLVFIKFAPDSTGARKTKFCGIYNFNLGRYALHNLGLTLLTSYTRANLLGPSLITDYTEDVTRWNTSPTEGAYSLEINQNNSAQGAFQQDDSEIIEFMADVPYSSQDTARAYDKAKQFYTRMANMVTTTLPKYTMDDAGQTPTKLIAGFATELWSPTKIYNNGDYVYTVGKITYRSKKDGNTSALSVIEDWENLGEIGTYYIYDSNYWQFSALDMYLNWDNACAYFMLALVFGMVDSMCKNLTIRNWGSNVWYTAFYDMDTAFGLNNSGQDIVEYWAHIHRYFNVAAQDTGITSTSIEKNYPPVNSTNTQQYFSSWWNRIWEVLEVLPVRDANIGDRKTLEDVYVSLRTNLFPDPETFIENYYKSYTDTTGGIIFNYDYKVKYLKIEQTYDPVQGYIDTTNFSQLKFLHGNRVMHVKDWFKKRIQFLDGIYGIKNNEVLLPISVQSPITQSWITNRATGTGGSNIKFSTIMSATSKVLHRWSYNNTVGSFWLDESVSQPLIPLPSGDIVVTLYANKNITRFGNFKDYVWTSLPQVNFPLLEDLDLSGLTIPKDSFFAGGVYNTSADIGLKNIRSLNLSNVVVTGTGVYTLDVSNCEYLQTLDISHSNITSVTLPTSAVLKYYNLSGTAITELVLSNQAFLSNLLIDNCLSLTKITIQNCNALTSLTIPPNVQEVNIVGCQLLSSLSITYVSQNNSISSLQSIKVENCPGLLYFNISGQNNPSLDVNLIGAFNLEYLDVSVTNTTSITLPSISNGFNSLKSLNIGNTRLSSLTFSDYAPAFLDLSAFPELDSIFAQSCKNLIRVSCTNDPDNPIDLYSGSFYGCSALTSLEGHYQVLGSGVFRGCSSLRLNSSYPNGTNGFQTTVGATNITFSPSVSSLLGCFEGCAALSYNDFKYLMPRLTSSITSIEAMFKGCVGINGDIWYDLFRACPNLLIIKEAFSNSSITGTFYSRAANYSAEDTQTWGVLDFIPNVLDAESAFEATRIQWIDNNVFAPIIGETTTYSTLVNIDGMFRGCALLQSCADTRAITPTSGLLVSETFFTNLINLISPYPSEVFTATGNVRMEVSEDSSGNTLLFHKTTDIPQKLVLTNEVYSGIKLVGQIKENVFGGVTKTLVGTNTYYIPTFTSIQYPFDSGSSELTVDLSQMGYMFQNIKGELLQAVGIFKGVKCLDHTTDTIPDNIFAGCTQLNSLEEFFSYLDLTNGGVPYTFPASGMFDDCTSLKVTKNMFTGCVGLRINLVGEGFKNCQLTDVSGMFSNSAVYGTIPYRLFFMHRPTDTGWAIRRTITNMTGLFANCWYLGYTSNRNLNIGQSLGVNGRVTTWYDHIVSTQGSKVSYQLDVSNLVKTYNYDLNSDILSEDYNPGEYAFDIWYLDGYGWEGASTLEETLGDGTDLADVKARLSSKYFIYDTQQAEVITDQQLLERYIPTNQNYMIPTDLFRYCGPLCDLSGVLSSLTWFENILVMNEETGVYSVESTTNIEGLSGRIPVKLFDSLTDSTIFNRVFVNTRFDAFVGLRWDNGPVRGIAYPPELFKYNTALTSISGLFAGTEIPVGVDVNTTLFANLSELRNVSGVWQDCVFDRRPYTAESFDESQLTAKQFDFTNIFINNTKITNASNLFAVSSISSEKPRGLYFIETSLLQLCYNLNNVGNMFYFNEQMKGNVPTFQAVVYPVLNIVSGYLFGCPKANIYNADTLELRLKPGEWS